MKTVNSLSEIVGPAGEVSGLALTIGNFDGVHRGHQMLLRNLKDHTQARGLSLVAVTFTPHPRKILRAPPEGFLLCSDNQRRRWLQGAGVDWLVEIPFTRDFSTLSAQQFLESYIFINPKIQEIYLGWDFAFGAHKSAGASEVRSLCAHRPIKVEVCQRYQVGNENVSSSVIRSRLSGGLMREAIDFLGRPFSLEGLVVKGEGRGKRLGVPTANLQLNPDLMLPARGVYITETLSRGMSYRSVTNVGKNPTFKEDGPSIVETHILDFDGDIYGEMIEVRFLDRLRDEKKFSSVEELLAQIHADIEKARAHAP